MNLRALIFALFVLLLVGCQDRKVYHRYAATDIEGWDVTERIEFPVDTLIEGGTFRPTLHLRITTGGEYPFQSIAIAVTQRWTCDTVLMERTDTLQCRFTTPSGHRLEKGISRSQFAYSLPALQLPARAVGKISIVHLMRKETIPGISDVGFSLAKREEELDGR